MGGFVYAAASVSAQDHKHIKEFELNCGDNQEIGRGDAVRIVTFRPKSAIELFDVRVVGRLAWPREVQRHAIRVCPQIKITRHELGSLLDTDREIRGQLTYYRPVRRSFGMVSDW